MSVVETISSALGAALHRDLPDRSGMVRGEPKVWRPRPDELEVYVFPELWSSTALGYGGMGGQAMTTAYTVIIVDRTSDMGLVYWGGSRLGRQVKAKTALEYVQQQSTQQRRQET